jgi:lysophospholipase L1-like esterase
MLACRVRHALLIAALLPCMAHAGGERANAWISTWSAAQQPPIPGTLAHYDDQTLRLIVHTSASGSRVRIRLSNLYGDTPLTISAAHIARRTHGADIEPSSDRTLTFHESPTPVIPAHSTALSDAIDMNVPALADLAVSLSLPKGTAASTVHILAQQTSYVSSGNNAGAAHVEDAKTIDMWPFLANVDVATATPTFTVVAFGDSTVDGDGSTPDANQRWPDALAARLQHAGKNIGVINEGLIGNRLLRGSPAATQFGPALGEAGVDRFGRDALDQTGARIVIVRTGSNDIGFMHALAPPGEVVSADDLIAGYRRLIAAAHQRGIRIVGTTLPPFENVSVIPGYATPAKDALRQQVNAWIRQSGEFDAVLDVDQIVRDPSHPARLLPAYDSGDHLHPNDEGYRAIAMALPLTTLDSLASRASRAAGTIPSSRAHATGTR